MPDPQSSDMHHSVNSISIYKKQTDGRVSSSVCPFVS